MTSASSGSNDDGDDEAPDIVGDFTIGNAKPKGGKAAKAEAVDDGESAPRQDRARGARRGGEQLAEQGRGADGKFAARESLNEGDVRSSVEAISRSMNGEEKLEARGIVRESMARARGEQPKALDPKVAKGQDSSSESDPAPKRSAATEKPNAEKASAETTADPVRKKHLESAREALTLDRWSDEELEGLSEDAILRLGREAKDKQVTEARRLRLEAEDRKDSGSRKPAATEPAKHARGAQETRADLEDEAAFVKSTKEHFRDFSDDAGFLEPLAKWTRSAVRSTVDAVRAEHAKELETVRAESAQTIAALRGEVRLMHALGAMRSAYPEVDVEGELAPILGELDGELKRNKGGDLLEVLRVLCEKHIGGKRKSGERARKVADAKADGHATTDRHTSTPAPKGEMALVRDAVREAMRVSG